jgi:hypothetical protein
MSVSERLVKEKRGKYKTTECLESTEEREDNLNKQCSMQLHERQIVIR